MTLLASWAAIDTHGISSAYIVSDSRISWENKKYFDFGKKVFASKKYPEIFDISDDQNVWFDKIKNLASELGFASDMKDYKANPDKYKGSVGDVAMILRLAITGKTMSPDTYAVMQILGKEKVLNRISMALEIISEGDI